MTEAIDKFAQFELVKNLILDHLDIFQKHGLFYREMTIEHSELLGDSVIFHFSNGGNGIQLQLGFFPGSAGRKRSFSIFITNARGQNLNVREFLRIHNRQDLLERFIDNSGETSLRAFASNFLAFVDPLFSGELLGILNGSRWEVVAINWQGYK